MFRQSVFLLSNIRTFLFEAEKKLMAISLAGRACHLRVSWEGTGVNDVMCHSSLHSSCSSTQLTNTQPHTAPSLSKVFQHRFLSPHIETGADLQHTHMLSNRQDWIKRGFVLDCNSWIPFALWIWEAVRR